jgi:Tol biopolymer transport system component
MAGSYALSLDSRQAATLTTAVGGRWRVALLELNGSPMTRAFDILSLPFKVQFTPRGDALTFLESRKDVPSLWNQPLSGGPPQQLLDMSGDRIFSFAWSRDGRVAIAHGPVPTDVVLLSGIR